MPGKRISTKKWQLIENEYVEGDISYRDLSEKHNISLNTLEKKALRENWHDKRRQYGGKLAAENERLQAKKAKERAAYIDRKRERELKDADFIRKALISKMLVDAPNGKELDPKLSVKDVKDGMLTLKGLQEYEDKALGIDSKLKIDATIEDKTNWRDKVERSAERTAEILTIMDECRNRKSESD